MRTLNHFSGGSRALRQAFTSVDLDGNGQLDYHELCEALKVNIFDCVSVSYFKGAYTLPKLGFQYRCEPGRVSRVVHIIGRK